MPSRYNFFDTVWNNDLNHNQKGFLRNDIKEILTFDDDILFTIPMELEYRPDLIATKFYGNPRLFWVITYVNEIPDSPEGYYRERVIRVPRLERLVNII